jgi:hypothetical protein
MLAFLVFIIPEWVKLLPTVGASLLVPHNGTVTLEYNSTLFSSYVYYKKIKKKPNITFQDYTNLMGIRQVRGFRHYNFIFGFSTGHVATGTFTDKKLYSPAINKRTSFVFEGKLTTRRFLIS